MTLCLQEIFFCRMTPDNLCDLRSAVAECGSAMIATVAQRQSNKKCLAKDTKNCTMCDFQGFIL